MDLKKIAVRNGRFILSNVYHKLKSKKVCDHCNQFFNSEVPQIHHIVPVSKGGTNEEYNLMAVHKECHKHLDKRAL